MKRFLLLVAAALTVGCGNMMADNTKGIYINEFLSNPPKDATYDDWFEIYNANSTAVNLKGWKITRTDDKSKVKTYEFTETIPAKGFITVDKAASFGIGKSGGDVLSLYDDKDNLVESVTAPKLSSGHSYARIPDGGSTWQDVKEPTKGASNGGVDPQLPTVDSNLKGVLFINEVVNAPATDNDADWIEIYNSSDNDIDLGGCALEDGKGVAEQFKMPAGTTIKAKGFLVYAQGQTGSTNTFTFGLASKGDEVYFVDSSNKLIDHVTVPNLKDNAGSSYARKTDGSSKFEVCDKPTKGSSNGTTPTGIKQLHKPSVKGMRYNLQGQRVGSNFHGLVIVDGKKVMVK